jgi:hypothetical protein
MANQTLVLKTSMAYPVGQWIDVKYSLDWSRAEACEHGLENYGIPPSDVFQLLLRQESGEERWIMPEKSLGEQKVISGMVLFIRVSPNQSQRSSRSSRSSRSVSSSRSSRDSRRGLDSDLSAFYVRMSDYERGEDIAKGKFCAVYCVRHKKTRDAVAVKRLHPNTEDDRRRLEYEREITILATIHHPTILSLVGCTPFDEPDGPSILTPLMRSSVQQYIELERKGKAPPEWTPTRKHIVLLGTAMGMAFMHEKNVIHRDLKPVNLLLDANNEPVVGDFGFSKFAESGTTISQSVRC